MQVNYIEKVTPSNISKLTDKPEHILGYEIQVASDLSQLSWMPTVEKDLYIEGFRLSGILNDEFDILHVIENFDHVFYLSQMVNSLCMKRHKYLYIAMGCSYSKEFYITNDRIFRNLVSNLLFLQRCFNYVKFIVENVPICHVHNDELVIAQNGGAPVTTIVNLLHNSGCFNVFSSVNYHNASCTIRKGYLLSDMRRHIIDYVDADCQLINMCNSHDFMEHDHIHDAHVLCPQAPIAVFDTGNVSEGLDVE